MSEAGPGFAVETLSLFQRMQLVFYAPRTAFAAVRGRETAHDWLLPALLVCLAVLIIDYLVPTATTESSGAAQPFAGATPKEEITIPLGWFSWTISPWLFYALGVPIWLFNSLVLVAAVLMAMARSLFLVEANYRQMLVIKAYAALVIVAEWVVRAVFALITGEPGVRLSVGALLSEGAAASFIGRVLLAVNPFDLWQIGIMGIGLSAMVDVPKEKAIIAILLLWLFWLVGGVGVETISRNLGSPPQG